jgi:hypothetical protein
VRRGADEIWLVWCIGNIPEYHDGLFNQYVHMIELSANGRLIEDLQAISAINADRVAKGRDPIRLHVVKPRFALPLDPVYYAGRITGEELVAMGYRDAADYLDGMSAAGVPLDSGATRMESPPAGRRVVEEMTVEGWAPQKDLPAPQPARPTLRLVVEAFDPTQAAGDGAVAGRVCGRVSLPGIGVDVPVRGGTLSVTGSGRSDAAIRYAAHLRAAGTDWSVEVLRRAPFAAGSTELSVRHGGDGTGPVVATASLREDSHTVDIVLRTLRLADPHPLRDRVQDVVDRIRGLLGRGSRPPSR